MTLFEWITGAISILNVACIVLLVIYLLHEAKNLKENYYLLAVAALIYMIGQAVRRTNLWRWVIVTDVPQYKDLPFYHSSYIIGTTISLVATLFIAYIIIGRSMGRWGLLILIYLIAILVPFIGMLSCF